MSAVRASAPAAPPLPWRHAIVVGASSGIGEAVARRLVASGCRTALLARRHGVLERLATESAARGGFASAVTHDVTDVAAVPALVESLVANLGGLDLLVYAAGIMPRVGQGPVAFDVQQSIIDVNLLGAIAWVDAVAARFADRGAGTIVAISSVAGDRGRRGNPVYAASKAGLTAYMEAMRNRLGQLGVRVVTIKPGPVATPMSAGLERLPFLISADRAAAAILEAAAHGTSTAYVPAVWRPIMLLLRSIPSMLFRRLDI